MPITNTNVTIMVKDMDRSVSFYQAIGFSLVNRWGDYYAQLQAPGIIIGLHPANQEYPGSGNTSLGFTTDNFEKISVLLKKLSIKAEPRVEEGGQFIHFEDPDGTLLYFVKPKNG